MEAIEFARVLCEMRDGGMGLEDLVRITGRSQEYLQRYLKLMDQGEERLIKGVEEGIFPLVFAINVAQSADRSIQHLLMDAFDNGIVTSHNLGRVRKIIEDRLEKGKDLAGGKRVEGTYTMNKLKGDIRQVTREKAAFVYESGQRENRIFRLLMALRQLRADVVFVALLKAEGMAEEPQLKGSYAV
jgi:ParB family chromosome partitioning protein